MGTRKATLVHVQDLPRQTYVRVNVGIPKSEERRFHHDENFSYKAATHDQTSEQHKQALRDAVAYATELAERYHAKCDTNF